MTRKTKRVDGISSHFEIEMKYPAWYNPSSTKDDAACAATNCWFG